MYKRLMRSCVRRLWPILKILNIRFIDEIEGTKFRFVPTERMSELAYRHFHEHQELKIVRNFLVEGDIFLDVGVNIGLYSCIASRKCGSKGLVVAVEPNYDVLPRLIENISINGATNICIVSAGASAVDGLGKLCCPPADFSAFSSMVQVPDSENWEQKIIPVMTLDTIWDRILHAKGVTYLKVDVEGLEYDVITGARKLLCSNCPPIVQFEVNRQAYSAHGVKDKNVVEIFEELGFRVYRLDNNLDEGVSEYMEHGTQRASENLFAVPPLFDVRFHRAVQASSI